MLSWGEKYLEKLKDQIQNAQNRRSVEKEHNIYETYKNAVMLHGRHIYAKASYITQATMCAYPQSYHALPHCKCVVWCCADCPCINIPYQ